MTMTAVSTIIKDVSKAEKLPTRDGFGKGLVELGAENPKVVTLCADLTESTRAQWFKEKFPTRFFEFGITEQTMMGAAAGFALSGKVPFACSYAVFNPGRNWDFLRVSVCYNNVNVKIVGAHAGISVGADGATHQALEDLALTRVLPNLTVVVPCDAVEARKATLAVGRHVGPCYLRLGRAASAVVTTESTPFTLGKAEVFREGKDVLLVACGIMVAEAMKAAETLSRKRISCTVLNMHTIKPLDTSTLIEWAKKSKAVVSCEEHQVNGGLGGAVAEALGSHHPLPLERVGVLDVFGESGSPEDLMKKYGLTAEHIVSAVQKVLGRR
ncbi:MAG TPA: transketolase family protein [Candidatus Nanoarchaeia archaeon]|nr:transketolase family protein [Candidatus Nanoarchaeia archaeon]